MLPEALAWRRAATSERSALRYSFTYFSARLKITLRVVARFCSHDDVRSQEKKYETNGISSCLANLGGSLEGSAASSADLLLSGTLLQQGLRDALLVGLGSGGGLSTEIGNENSIHNRTLYPLSPRVQQRI